MYQLITNYLPIAFTKLKNMSVQIPQPVVSEASYDLLLWFNKKFKYKTKYYEY